MGRGEALYAPMIKSQSFSELVSLDLELHKCFSVFPPFRWSGTDAGGWCWVFPFPQVRQALTRPQQVKLWLNSFSCRPTLSGRTEDSGMFECGSFTSPPVRSLREFFSDTYRKNLLELQSVTLTEVTGSPRVSVFPARPH